MGSKMVPPTLTPQRRANSHAGGSSCCGKSGPTAGVCGGKLFASTLFSESNSTSMYDMLSHDELIVHCFCKYLVFNLSLSCPQDNEANGFGSSSDDDAAALLAHGLAAHEVGTFKYKITGMRYSFAFIHSIEAFVYLIDYFEFSPWL